MTLLRSLLFNIVYFTTTFAMALYGVIACHSQERAFRLSRAWGRTSLFLARALCGMRLEVSGLEHVPKEGPALIACGHQSAFDTMVWLVLLPRTAYVMKQEVGRIPLFGALTLRAGMISVDRDAGAAAIRALARAARSAAAAGRQIVIFPQGTRVAPGEIVTLQPGIAAAAAGSRLPVIPARIDSGLLWGRRHFLKRAGTIHLRILPPLPAGLARPELMRRLTAALDGDNSVGHESAGL
jgi:1-acyl-sn-glycerol-3-phosphate acyltransferase